MVEGVGLDVAMGMAEAVGVTGMAEAGGVTGMAEAGGVTVMAGVGGVGAGVQEGLGQGQAG